MSKVYVINPRERRIYESSYDSSEALHDLVGGYIELAYQWPSGDVLYVDENGLARRPQWYFGISVRPDQLLAGNGVLVGREIVTEDDVFEGTAPPSMSLEALQRLVRWAPGRVFPVE